MNETFKKISKFISRNFGFFLINLSVLLIVFSFFINSGIDNIDSLKKDLETSVQEQFNVNNDQVQLALEYCKINPKDERCSQLNQDNPYNELFDNVKAAKNYIKFAIIGAIILFLLGFMFVYLGVFNLLITSYKVSGHLTIHNFLTAIYFNFIPDLVNKSFNTNQFNQITQNIPKEIVDKFTSIILNWLETPLFSPIRLTIILGVIFLMITLILYFVKKKALKVENKS